MFASRSEDPIPWDVIDGIDIIKIYFKIIGIEIYFIFLAIHVTLADWQMGNENGLIAKMAFTPFPPLSFSSLALNCN